MAISCPNLPSLPRSFGATAAAPGRSPLFSQHAPIPRRSTFAVWKNTDRSRDSHHLLSATRDDSLTSLVSQLEHDAQEEELDADMSGRHRPRYEDKLVTRWREILGCDDWAGLLDPMDPLLRSQLIRYGECAQACYDAFDYDVFSRYCGSCKYPRRAFFACLGMAGSCGYEVSRYLYATSNFKFPNFFSPRQSRTDAKIWSQRANWIGYIAVSTDEESARIGRRDVVIAWRGTITRLEWVSDLMDFLRPVSSEGIPCPDPGVKVESGFIDLYTDKDPTCRFCKYSAREQVLTEVRKLVDHYSTNGEEVSITITGHSLGSALAMLSAYDIAETGVNVSGDKKAPICVFSFSGPRVGNVKFKERFEGELGIKALRIVNVHDSVPRMPGILFNEGVPEFVRKLADGLPWCYSHVGVELALDHKRSPFLKDTIDPSCFHNLEAHLHLLDGYHGRGQRFVLSSGRDPALVNKACDFLKDHHMVPPFWWQDENKGMVRAHDGRWVQPDRHKYMDDHPADTHHHLRLLSLASDKEHHDQQHEPSSKVNGAATDQTSHKK